MNLINNWVVQRTKLELREVREPINQRSWQDLMNLA